LYQRLGVDAPFDPQHKLVTSPAFSPVVLALIRLSLAFYTLFTALFILIWEAVVTHQARSYVSWPSDTIVTLFLTFEQVLFILYRPVLYRSLCLLLGIGRSDSHLCKKKRERLSSSIMAALSTISAHAFDLHHSNIPYVPPLLSSLHHRLTPDAAILVTIVFWSLLASSSTFETPYSSEFHLLDANDNC